MEKRGGKGIGGRGSSDCHKEKSTKHKELGFFMLGFYVEWEEEEEEEEEEGEVEEKKERERKKRKKSREDVKYRLRIVKKGFRCAKEKKRIRGGNSDCNKKRKQSMKTFDFNVTYHHFERDHHFMQ